MNIADIIEDLEKVDQPGMDNKFAPQVCLSGGQAWTSSATVASSGSVIAMNTMGQDIGTSMGGVADCQTKVIYPSLPYQQPGGVWGAGFVGNGKPGLAGVFPLHTSGMSYLPQLDGLAGLPWPHVFPVPQVGGPSLLGAPPGVPVTMSYSDIVKTARPRAPHPPANQPGSSNPAQNDDNNSELDGKKKRRRRRRRKKKGDGTATGADLDDVNSGELLIAYCCM